MTILVGKVALARNKVRVPVSIDIFQHQGMRLRKEFADLMRYPRGIALFIFHLLMPPDTIVMCRGTNDILVTIFIHIQYIHISAVFTKVCGMKSPVTVLHILRRLPPAT